MTKLINFKNKMKYIHVPTDKKNEMVSIGFIVKVGSRDEDLKNNGISHFLEHMLFKGTKKRNTSKLLNELDNLGTYYNAMTTYDFTLYEIHGNKKDFMKLLKIFVNLYLGANLYQKDINKERNVILEEFNMVAGDISEIITNKLMYEIFEGSNLDLPVIGDVDNIMNFKRNDLVKYRNKFYCPANTTFITVGDIDFKKVSEYLDKNIKFTCNQDNDRMHVIPIQKMPRLDINYIKDLGQAHILFGFHHNGYLHKEEYNFETRVISSLLTSGSASLLFDSLRTKNPLAYSVSSYNADLEDTSIFNIQFSVDETKCDTAIELVMKSLKEMLKNGITDSQLKKIKKNYLNETNLSIGNSELMYYYLEESLKNNFISFEYNLEKMKKLTKNRINKAIKHIFRFDNLNLVLYGDLKEKVKKNIINSLDEWYHYSKKKA